MNLEDSGSSLATIKNPTVNDEKCGRGYCRCFDFLVNIVSSVIRASAAIQSFYNIEVAIVFKEKMIDCGTDILNVVAVSFFCNTSYSC